MMMSKSVLTVAEYRAAIASAAAERAVYWRLFGLLVDARGSLGDAVRKLNDAKCPDADAALREEAAAEIDRGFRAMDCG
jgi:hypothetical protein